MKRNNLNVLTYGYMPLTYIPNWFRNIRQFFRNIKYAYQRVTRGFCDQDVWNLDNFYSDLFYQTLRHLSNTTIGYPGVGEFSDENGGFDAWQNYLNEMAEHFLNTQEWNEDIPINQEIMHLFDEMNEYVAEERFVRLPDSKCSKLETIYKDEEKYNEAKQRWLDKETEAWKFREDEKNKAFDMMQKYFFSLWD